jgi:hypothetical protein
MISMSTPCPSRRDFLSILAASTLTSSRGIGAHRGSVTMITERENI